MSKVRRIFYPPGTTPVNRKILANVFLSMVGAIIFHRLRSKYMRQQMVGISQLVLQTTF